MSKDLPNKRHKLRDIIFEAETPAGKAFDLVLLVLIILSVAAVMLESISEFKEKYGTYLVAAEWIFTIAFSLEYLLRLYLVDRSTASLIYSAASLPT